MGIPVGHCRVSLLGHLGSSEQFDTSFWTLGGADIADTDDMATAIATAFLANDTHIKNLMDASCGFDELRVYAYPGGGPTADHVSTAPMAAAGTNASINQPYQSAVVCSLRTGFAGRSRRGRMYFPNRSLPAGSTGLLTAATVNTVADDLAAFFTAVNGIALTSGGNPSVVVVSQTHSDSQIVETVAVDTRPDIQRRRANKIVIPAPHVATVT